MKLENGYLIVLPRDDAKQFFGLREDHARLDFVKELLTKDETESLSLHGKWQELHNALEGVPMEDSVLAQCILGGRPMHQGNDHHVCLVRPDVVGFIAQQGAQLEKPQVGADLWESSHAIMGLYKAAAGIGAAMVFVASATN